MNTTVWYADGLRWIGSLFNDAADHFQRAATNMAELDPRMRDQADEYMNNVRSRAYPYL